MITPTRSYQPTKVTLAEAEAFCRVTGLRDLRMKHPYALKVIFQDWDDTASHFEWMVYYGDLEYLKEQVQKIAPSPVIEVVKSIANKVYSYEELAAHFGKTPKSMTMLRYYFRNLFVPAPQPVGFRGVGAFFKAETIDNIAAYYATIPKSKAERLAKMRQAKHLKKLARESSGDHLSNSKVAKQHITTKPAAKDMKPVAPNLDIAVLLIQNGFADAGVWLIKNKS